MQQKALTVQNIVIGVLALALVIVIAGWAHTYGELSRGEVRGGLSEFRTDIAAACSDTTSEEGRERCSDKISEFRNALDQYSIALNRLEGAEQ